MSLLAKCFREQTAKMKDSSMSGEHEFDIAYPTGFLSFDFLNGNIVQTVRPTGEIDEYFSIGIVDGSINTFIGRSGCGKTTFAVQTAANIIRPFENANMFIDSIEGGITIPRLTVLTGWSGEELRERVIERNSDITAENFYKRIKLIYDLKKQNQAEMTYNTGRFDDLGNPVYKYIPTPYILDSLAMLMPETYADEDELAGQMAATAAAKTNTRILKMIVPKLKAVNIILLLINHVNQKVDINPMAKKKSQVAYLNADETMPGGNAAIYLANNIVRFDDVKLKSNEGLNIEGYVVSLKLVKSRTARSGRSINLVFDQANGFDPDLSMFIMLKEAGVITGAGAFFHIQGSDIKFTQKGFKTKLYEDPQLQQDFMNATINYLKQSMRDDYSNIIKSKEQTYNVTHRILEELNKVAS